MGTQIYQSQYPPDNAFEPGTYRILHAQEGTAIQVSEHDPTQVVTWKQHSGENQKWYLQRSGHGYQLRNRHYDAYLAVSNSDNNGLVYASRYPTTWIFLKFNENYIIQLADKNQILNLDHGSGHNGNVIHIFNQDGTFMPHRIWKLERLSDDSGREEPAKLKEEIAKKNKELSQLQDALSSAKNDLSEFRTLLHQRDDTIRQLRQELKSKEEALSHTYKAIEEFALLRNQYKLLESKFSQQQAEIASHQAKADARSSFFPFGAPATYDHSIAAAMAFVFLSLLLYRPLRRGLGETLRLFWRGIYGLYILAAY
ncbi:ricin-type beta-trefoil lectin domain protein [Rhizoctonia solani 123E]|uniref:Ricin-type beta-trefoil lectin domain protein n=1 Tax=Rhizoctonia solani 123E TaxID=1423351 RepID=A0A074SA89_9AGAM|nr:ricin-type beta-trefoil lectin domain protein [Rhizoctonia solani 123E]